MRKFVTGAVIVCIILIALMGGYYAGTNRPVKELDKERHVAEETLQSLHKQLDDTQTELNDTQTALSESHAEMDTLRRSHNDLQQQLEQVNNTASWYDQVLRTITNGDKINFQTTMTTDRGVIVFVPNAPTDYYERQQLLIKLGAEFAEHDRVTFWYDANQAQLFEEGKLQPNEDEMLPPYAGMFGEIIMTENDVKQLRLHGSTGGPLNLAFGIFE